LSNGGDNLRRLIESRDVTIKSVYEDMNVSMNAFTRWLSGYNIISYRYIDKIKQVLYLDNKEYSGLLSSVQMDVINQWRNKE